MNGYILEMMVYGVYANNTLKLILLSMHNIFSFHINCEFKARNVSMGICPRYQNDKEISVKVQIKKKLMLYSY